MSISNLAFFESSKIPNVPRWQSWKSIFRDFGWRCKNVMTKTKLCKLLQSLLIEGILHHLRCIESYKQWEKLPINYCRVSYINCTCKVTIFSFNSVGLSSRGLRFVVHRGTEGFGDRLQQLLMAMRYARATGRALVIDWRDAKCLGPKELFLFFLDHLITWNHGVCHMWCVWNFSVYGILEGALGWCQPDRGHFPYHSYK